MTVHVLIAANRLQVPGGAFGEPRCLRISYAASLEDLEEAMVRMKSALAELR